MTRDEYLKRFEQIEKEMLELTRIKNHDYGEASDPFKNFRKHGTFGILVRLDDKLARLSTPIREKRELKVKSETIHDTLTDIAVYAIIMRIMIEEEEKEQIIKEESKL